MLRPATAAIVRRSCHRHDDDQLESVEVGSESRDGPFIIVDALSCQRTDMIDGNGVAHETRRLLGILIASRAKPIHPRVYGRGRLRHKPDQMFKVPVMMHMQVFVQREESSRDC